jgi:hypothetical protein
MMTKARSARQRRMQIEALEGRLAMSGGVAALHSNGAEVFAHKIPKTIPITYTAHFSYSGSSVLISGASGKLGKIHLTGQGSGTIVGDQFEGSSVVLSNAAGTITLDFGPGTLKRAGKNVKLKVTVSAELATGAYNMVEGSMGNVTELTPIKVGAASKGKGDFNSFETGAATELGY